jgi:hypothetical protein
MVAAILSEIVGRRIVYRDIALDALRAQLVAAGTPPWLVDVRMEFTSVLREGFAAAVTDTVARTTGHPPRTFAAFAAEHAARFRGAASA